MRRLKKEKREALDIDITSLLDILVILLVFLLKSYNPTDLTLDLTKNLKLPESGSISLGSKSIMVQVSAQRDIFIDQTKIGVVSKDSGKIDVLFDELEKIKTEQVRKIAQAENTNMTDAQLKSLISRKENINIVLDQSLPYSVLQKVMHTAALAGYPKFKFIVQGNM